MQSLLETSSLIDDETIRFHREILADSSRRKECPKMAKNASALFLRPYLLRRGLGEIRSARRPICPGWTGDMCGIFSSPPDWGGWSPALSLGGL